jgi:predicted house-cleaning NTP pyrophosphatase (Maf/HAM1 superfamily)
LRYPFPTSRSAGSPPVKSNTIVATGEPFDKAGGYAIQGRAAVFITRLEGAIPA